MKRLNPPESPSPYVPPTVPETAPTHVGPAPVSVPAPGSTAEHTSYPKSLHGVNLLNIPGYHENRRSLKFQSQKNEFMRDVTALFAMYNVSEHNADDSILVMVLDCAERFFIWGNKSQRDEAKHAAVQAVMLPFYKNDPEFLEKAKKYVWWRVTKTSLAKRLIQKAVFFLSRVRQLL